MSGVAKTGGSRPRRIPERSYDEDLQLASRLRHAREAQRITRREVAAALGVSAQQVEKYEIGITRLSIGALLRFARVVGVSPAALLMDLSGGAYGGEVFADACIGFRHLTNISAVRDRVAAIGVLEALAAREATP